MPRKAKTPHEKLRLAQLAMDEAKRELAEYEKKEAEKTVKKLFKKYKTYNFEEIEAKMKEQVRMELLEEIQSRQEETGGEGQAQPDNSELSAQAHAGTDSITEAQPPATEIRHAHPTNYALKKKVFDWPL
ncbi:hypothetical protein SFC55_27020 [Niallia taxi]|uniref:hypothetical protein n=1 Tax=Niallia taxi TaxID=2499688 RepID=UPI003982D19D